MANKRELRGSHLFWLICFLAVFRPNCTRACPDGCGGCQCEWAWESCPAQSGGCNSGGNGCNNASTASGLTTTLPSDPIAEGGAAHAQTPPAQKADPGVVDPGVVDPGGTLAFVTTESGTFAVAAVGANDELRVVRVDVGPLDQDPVTARTVGVVALASGDEPTRVIGDGHGRALVALRGAGSVATIDPLAVLVGASVGARSRVCDSPRGLALGSDGTVHVACASGDLVSIRGAESTRVSLGTKLDDVTTLGDSLLASAGARLFVVDANGAVSARDTGDAVGPLRSTPGGAFVAVGSELSAFGGDGFGVPSEVPAAIADVAIVGDASALAAGGDAFFRPSAAAHFEHVGGPGLTRAVALADVVGEHVTRRLLAIQTVSPRMLVFFTTTGTPTAVAFEPLE